MNITRMINAHNRNIREDYYPDAMCNEALIARIEEIINQGWQTCCCDG